MAKKVTGVAVELVDTIPDVSSLSASALAKIIQIAQERKQELDKANLAAESAFKEAAFKEAKKSDKVKAIKAEFKELDKEFKSIIKKDYVATYTVPVTFNVSIYSKEGDDLMDSITYNEFDDVEPDDLFGFTVEGVLGKGDIPKDAAILIQDKIDDLLCDACSEALRLTPEVKKISLAFTKKLNKVTAKAVRLYDEMHTPRCSVKDLFQD